MNSNDDLRHEKASTRPRARSLVLALGLASGVSVAFFASAPIERLPTYAWAAVFLFFAVASDVRSLRIPNALNLTGGLVALVLAFALGGPPALLAALGAAGLAFALLFPLFALGALGAGDVKALMVLAAFFGVSDWLGLLWWSAVCGGALGLAWMVIRGGLGDLARRWWRSGVLTLTARQWVYVPPAPTSVAARGVPFALAIGVGATAHQLWGIPWV